MPTKPKKSEQAKVTAKNKEPKSKFLYELSAGDLPHYTGSLTFDGSNSERAGAIQEHFPSYDCADPRTFVAIPYSAIRASLGGDYTGQEKFPPYVAYPAMVARSFSKYALKSMGLGNRGTLHRLFPLNFDQRGRLRDSVGMTKAELAQFLFRFADGTKKQPRQADKKTRERNLKAWLMMERDEEKRETKMAQVDQQSLTAEADGVDEIRRQREKGTTVETMDASDGPGDGENESSVTDSKRGNNRKRSSDKNVAASGTNGPAVKKRKFGPT